MRVNRLKGGTATVTALSRDMFLCLRWYGPKKNRKFRLLYILRGLVLCCSKFGNKLLRSTMREWFVFDFIARLPVEVCRSDLRTVFSIKSHVAILI